jgi:phage I-like protein
MKIDFDLRDLNRPALERLVKKLLTASDDEEKEIMERLGKEAQSKDDATKESADLADLKEEKSGKPSPIDMEAEPTRRKRDG